MSTRIRSLRSLVDLIFSTRCGGCGDLGTSCCDVCLTQFTHVRRVRRGLIGDVPIFALAPYQGSARRMVLTYKEHGRRDVALPLAMVLAAALHNIRDSLDTPNLVHSARFRSMSLVPVPSRPSASRLRGGAHISRLARLCAQLMTTTGESVVVNPALRLSGGARDSLGLSRRERVANLSGRVTIHEAYLPPAANHVVLIDDVVTTGATASVCIEALTKAHRPVSAVLALTATGQ